MRWMLISGVLVACGSDTGTKTFNANPSIQIMSHAETVEGVEGDVLSFRAQTSDTNHDLDELNVIWYLDQEPICDWETPSEAGESFCEIQIGAVDAVVVAEVHDPIGAAGRAQVNLLVTPNDPPRAEILQPTAVTPLYSDQLVAFVAEVGDNEDPAENLNLAWESSLDGVLSLETIPDSNGRAQGAGYLSQGEHLVQLLVTDSGSKVTTDSVLLQVKGPNTPPQCEIVTPQSLTGVALGEMVIFSGFAADDDVGAEDLSFSWSSDKDGLMGSGSISTAGEILFPYDGLSVDTHTITLEVSDEVGALCSDLIVFTVGSPPTLIINSPSNGDLVQTGEAVLFDAVVSDSDGLPADLTLEWHSNIDGVFSNRAADSNGLISFSHSTFSAGAHNITVTVTDDIGLTTTGALSLTVNTPPTSPSLTLLPTNPTTADSLLVTAAGSSDAEGDPIVYAYEWYLNGSLTSHQTATVSSLDTSKNESWMVRVTPNDGYHDGPFAEAIVVIENTAPVISGLSIAPNAPSNSELLACSFSSSDVDGETLTDTITWTNLTSGATLGTGATLQLSSSLAVRGDVIECLVETADSDTSVSASVTEIISNSPPDAPVVAIAPNPAYSASILECLVSSASDPDGDALTLSYSWYVNSILQAAETSAIYGGAISTGDIIVCTVVSSDGIATSPMGSDSVTIVNNPPVIDSLVLSPIPLYTNDTLTATVVASDADGDAITINYEWSVNGALVQSGIGNSLTGGLFSRGDMVSVSVTPSDANASGAAANDSVTVSNSAPSGASTAITPQAPVENVDDLTCSGSSATDLDGDAVTYVFSWTVDGVAFNGATSSFTSSTVAAINTFAGEAWECTVTPTDGSDAGASVSTTVVISSDWSGALTFTNCGQSGRDGPSQSQCDSAYAGGDLAGQVSVSAGFQSWTVPSDGVYSINALGAQGGGNAGGSGSDIYGEFSLVAGDVLVMVIGQTGSSETYSRSYIGGAGGGGSFVTLNGSPLIIAGGGGGSGADEPGHGGIGTQTDSRTGGPSNGGSQSEGCGGAGFTGNGSGTAHGGASTALSYTNGALGGIGNSSGGTGIGGFGGGGCDGYADGGGGGGYSGGNGYGDGQAGGGGGSYNDGSNQANTSNSNSGHGTVIIDRP